METSDQGYKEILALYNAGILCGNDKLGNFAPTTNVTRAEFAAMFTRLTDVTSRGKIHPGDDVRRREDHLRHQRCRAGAGSLSLWQRKERHGCGLCNPWL